MSRIAKLNRRFLAGGKLSFAEFQRILEAYEFQLRRVRGSHHTYARDGTADQLSIQPNGKDAMPYQLKQFLRILEENGLTLDGIE